MIDDMKKELKKDPSDFEARLNLIEAYMNEGHWDEILHTINDVEAHTKPKSHKTLRHFLRPVLKVIRGSGEAQYLETVLRLLERYDEDDTVAMKWLKKGRKDIEKRYHGGVFPSSVSYRDWWNGPHTEAPASYKDWTPGTILSIKDGKAELLLMSREDNAFLSVDEIILEEESLVSLSKGHDPQEGDFFEMFTQNAGDGITFVYHK